MRQSPSRVLVQFPPSPDPKAVDETTLLGAIKRAIQAEKKRIEEASRRQLTLTRLASLSPREKQVLGSLLTGELNKQIVARLGIVEKTVKVHRARGFNKTGSPIAARTIAALQRSWYQAQRKSPALSDFG